MSNQIIKKIKGINLSAIPFLIGLLFVFFDIIYWARLMLLGIKGGSDTVWIEGIMVVGLHHLPSSFFAAIIEYAIFPEGDIISFYIIIFILGLIQYFIIGYFFGWVIFGLAKLVQRYKKQLTQIKDILLRLWRKINVI